MTTRLIHDTAHASAVGLMQSGFASLFYEHERREGFQIIYEHIRAALETFDILRGREASRLLKMSEN